MRELITRFKVGTWSIVLFVYLILGIFLIVPIGFIFLKCFYINGEVTFSFLPLLLQNQTIVDSMWNSLKISVVTTIATTLLCLPLCLIVLRNEFSFKSLFQGLLLVPMIMPPFVGAIGIKNFFAAYGSVTLLLMKFGLITAPIDWL